MTKREPEGYVTLRASGDSSRLSLCSDATRRRARGLDPEESNPFPFSQVSHRVTIAPVGEASHDVGADATAPLVVGHSAGGTDCSVLELRETGDHVEFHCEAERSQSQEYFQDNYQGNYQGNYHDNFQDQSYAGQLDLDRQGANLPSQSSTISSITKSLTSDKSMEGCCEHHPEIRLQRPKGDGNWILVRKRCPLCAHNRPLGLIIEPASSPPTRTSSAASALATSQTPDELAHLHCRLAARAYHFSGNTWFEDWVQYMSNTHTVLGLFFHHPLHPIVLKDRLLILLGSISIGLTLSNLSYLYFLFKVDRVLTSRIWTIGGFLHNLFDLGLWHIKACTICYDGQIDDRTALCGRVFGLVIVFLVTVTACCAVFRRACIDAMVQHIQMDSFQDDWFYTINPRVEHSYGFLVGNLVDFMFDIFIFYPLTVTILFSGVLSFGGRLPILGGRPREVQREKRYQMNEEASSVLRTFEPYDTEEDQITVASSGSDYDDDFDQNDETQIV